MAETSLWTGVSATGSGNDGGQNYALGQIHDIAEDCVISQGEWTFPAVEPSGVTGYRLYDDETATLLATAVFPTTGGPGKRRSEAFTPVEITAPGRVMAVVYTQDEYVVATSALPRTNGILSATEASAKFATSDIFPTGNTASPTVTYLVDIVATTGSDISQPLGLASETDSALALGRLKARTLGVAATIESALALVRTKSRVLGMAVETNTARPLGGAVVSVGADPPIVSTTLQTVIVSSTRGGYL